MTIDPETVTMLPTYRVGFLPPAPGSLSAGELYVEIGALPPRLWVGTMAEAETTYEGDVALLATATAPDVATTPPINRDVPHAYQEADHVTCTMGNWSGRPDAYAYQWRMDGATDVGDGTGVYTIVDPDDIGHEIDCVVTATNELGTTEAPPSNTVTIAAPTGA